MGEFYHPATYFCRLDQEAGLLWVALTCFCVVSRIEGKTEVYEFDVVLDVNTELYPMAKGDFYKISLASATSMDGEANDYYSIVDSKNTLFDEYEYVMHGKVFRYELHDEDAISQYISFGGLIMKIKGDVKYLKCLEIDSKVFLLMKSAVKQY